MQAYLMILQDPNLVQETIKMIEQEQYNAAYATEMGFNSIIQMFEKMDDPYMAARSADILDMKKKVLSKILHKEEINLSKLPKNTILVTKELSTSDTAKLDFKNIAGMITEIRWNQFPYGNYGKNPWNSCSRWYPTDYKASGRR